MDRIFPGKTMGQPGSKIVSETCEAVDQARLSMAKTQHAIEQNRKSTRQIEWDELSHMWES